MLNIYGNIITIQYSANELTNNIVNIQLPDGYSFEKIIVTYSFNVYNFAPYSRVIIGSEITFPPVNSKSPCIVTLAISDLTKRAEFSAIICKFGQIPDPNYFNSTFNPILVTGDDGNEYPVIPSDQFK